MGPARARAGLAAARLAFEQRDVTRGCAMIADARLSAGSTDVELRNQIDYHGARCPTARRAALRRRDAERHGGGAPAVGRRAPPTVAIVTATERRRAAVRRRQRLRRRTRRRATRRRVARTRPDAGRRQPRAARTRAERQPRRRRSRATKASAPRGIWTIQLAAYNTRADAEALVKKLAARGVKARISGDAKPFRVRLDYYATRQEPRRASQTLKQRGIIGFVTEEPSADGSDAPVSGAVATPLMQQYREIKARHQSAILFFRMGDFYEMFYEDAETASRVLGLTLTSRNNGGAAEVPLAGVPVKAGSEYLRRLVQQGYRVAICEQVEDPQAREGDRAARGRRDGHARRRVRRRPARRRAQQLHLRDRLADAGDGVGDRHRRRRRLHRRAAPRGRAARTSSTRCWRGSRRASCSCRAATRRRCRAPRRSTARSSRSAKRGSSTRRWRATSSRGSSACASLDGLGLERSDDAGDRRRGRAAALPAASCSPAACRISRVRVIERAGRHDAARRDDAPQPRAGGVAARRRARRERCSPCSTAR